MTAAKPTAKPRQPLDLDDFAEWIIARGMRGLPLDDQFADFCKWIHDAGFPVERASMGMATLHPRYGARTFVWRPGDSTAQHILRERSAQQYDALKQSPIQHMATTRVLSLRRRLDTGEPPEFPILDELRDEGMTDYAAHLLPYDPSAAARADFDGLSYGRLVGVFNGIFFSCATDRPEGFDDGQLGQVIAALPYLAMAVKSRSTYDVAETVLGVYLGKDAGHRVLTGEIERGSVETIRAVIWFCDLRGFTRLSDTVPRDALVELLDDYLDAMARPVHDNHGQILKFMGDGFLATFDLTQRDDEMVCRNALKAAAELCETFPSFNSDRKAAGKPVTDFGLALNLGEVLYGNIGSRDRLDFTVIGPAVNEASRIQALCRPLGRQLLISGSFHAVACGCHGELVSLGFHALRGLREPQELFTLAD